MATATAKKTSSKVEIPWPKNLVVEGVLSFPLTSESDLEKLQEWRTRRKIAAPQYPDKIGVNLLLNQAQYDKARTYLGDVYLPFVNELYALTDGSKGVEPEAVELLKKQVADEQWLVTEGRKEKPNLPLRFLTDKDREHLPTDDEYVYKIKISGPYEKPFSKKAIVKVDGVQVAKELGDIELPSERSDWDDLWWGAGWHFRMGVRMNAFEQATLGVTAYGSTMFLLPHHGLPVNGGAGEAQVLEDGDDWE